MENKFKEFWIDHDDWYSEEEIKYSQNTEYPLNKNNLVHTIEYGALESANAEIAALKERERLIWNQASIQEKALVALELENKKLSDENARLRAALEDCAEGLEGHFGPLFWESKLGIKVNNALEKIK